MRRSFLSLFLVCAAVACNGPTGLMSGGELDGEVAPPPSDWSSVGDYGTGQLETRPEDPYSVNIVYTVVNAGVYVNAGNTETNWVQNIAVNPDVRLRIDGTLYELRAKRVTEASDLAAFGQAWTSQSSFRRDPTEIDGEVWVYRLVAR
jgi:hypothetical protein